MLRYELWSYSESLDECYSGRFVFQKISYVSRFVILMPTILGDLSSLLLSQSFCDFNACYPGICLPKDLLSQSILMPTILGICLPKDLLS